MDFPAAISNTCLRSVGSLPGKGSRDRCRGSHPPLVALAKCWPRFLGTGAGGSQNRLEMANWKWSCSQALPPAFGSHCQAQKISRNGNWSHYHEEIYAVVTVTSEVPRGLNQEQHPGVCWIQGRHGRRRLVCSQPEGQREPRFGQADSTLLVPLLQSTAGQETLAATCWCSHATAQRVRRAAWRASLMAA